VGELVYNFLNPVAARDNALQAAADLLAIPRSLASFAAAGIPLDGARMSLYGHSQGGNAASLVAARQSPYGTIVMSGTGGSLIQTLLGKTKPVNLPAVLPFLLGEQGAASVDAGHPVLNLMQMFFERSDSVSFGRRLFREPVTGMPPHHVLHVYGLDDNFSVVPTQRAYALAAGFKVAGPVLDSYGLDPVTMVPPISNNEYYMPVGRLTAMQLQYQPDATYDGHFVSTQHPKARAAIQQMLVTAARDGIPSVTP
jgi:pimeloyl-ACP methyl ester carboxylesterase